MGVISFLRTCCCRGSFIFLFLVGFSFSLPAQGLTFTSAQKDTIRSYLERFPDGVQFAVGLVKDGGRSVHGLKKGNKGYKELSNADSVFEIGSLTKVFTANLLATYVQEGIVKLQDTVWDHLEVEPKQDTPITFRHLVTHTSGLPKLPGGLLFSSGFSLKNPYKGYDREKLKRYFKKQMKLKSAPGEEYRYSNLGYGLLDHALKQISGNSYEDLLQERLVGPLGMEGTSSEREELQEHLVQGWNKKGKPTPYWDLGAMKGAGAIYSSISDLLIYMEAQFDTVNKPLQLQQSVLHPVNHNMSMAMGWHVLKRDGGTEWHWHNGGTGGFRSSMVLNVAEKKGVVVLSNISAGHKHAGNVDKLSYVLLKNL